MVIRYGGLFSLLWKESHFSHCSHFYQSKDVLSVKLTHYCMILEYLLWQSFGKLVKIIWNLKIVPEGWAKTQSLVLPWKLCGCKDLAVYYNPPMSARCINDTSTGCRQKRRNSEQKNITHYRTQTDTQVL